MGVPKTHRSKVRQRNKRSQIYIERKMLTSCPKCGKPVLPHTLCQSCGNYRGKEFIDVMAKLTKKERKRKEKEMAAKQEENKKPLNTEDLSKNK